MKDQCNFVEVEIEELNNRSGVENLFQQLNLEVLNVSIAELYFCSHRFIYFIFTNSLQKRRGVLSEPKWIREQKRNNLSKTLNYLFIVDPI